MLVCLIFYAGISDLHLDNKLFETASVVKPVKVSIFILSNVCNQTVTPLICLEESGYVLVGRHYLVAHHCREGWFQVRSFQTFSANVFRSSIHI